MKAIKFKEANTTFVKENCIDLPTCYIEGQIISCWNLTLKERLKVLFGNNIWLHIQGHSQPPVYLDVETPFKNDA